MCGLCNYRSAECTTFSPKCLMDTESGRNPRTGAGPCASPHRTRRSLQDSVPSSLPPLTPCIFIALSSAEGLSMHLQQSAAPCVRMENVLHITSPEPNWSEEPIIPCSLFYPFCLSAPCILKLTVTYKTLESRIVHATHFQKMPKKHLISFNYDINK